ncbi:MAG: DUF1846 family protein, partial [Candidatus Omnitrophica bacterium]|nr:DUF1846 family protein [Candidatus Omnitrophota bacterium]
VDKEILERSKFIMEGVDLRPEQRKVVKPARKAAGEAQRKKKGNEGIFCGAALKLKNGSIVTGKNSPLMHAASSLALNAIKELAEIPDKIHLLSPAIIDSIGNLKRNISAAKNVSLDLEETLIALSISAATNPTAQLTMEKLKELEGCEMHTTHIPTPGDEAGLRQLGVNLTSDPNFSTKTLFVA